MHDDAREHGYKDLYPTVLILSPNRNPLATNITHNTSDKHPSMHCNYFQQLSLADS